VQSVVDKGSTYVFNEFGDDSSSGNTEKNNQGYRVDTKGCIELPVVVGLMIIGLTLDQAKEAINENSQKYYITAAVQINSLNFYIIVYGDVSKPGRIVF